MDIKYKIKSVKDLTVSEQNVRKEGVDEDIDMYTSSIKKHGLIQPLVVDSKGRVFIGQKRLKALEKAGVEKVLVIEVPEDVAVALEQKVTDEEALMRSIIENTVRKPVPMKDLQNAIRTLSEKYGSIKRVAEVMGISEDVLKIWGSFAIVEPRTRRKGEDIGLLLGEEKSKPDTLKPVSDKPGIVEKPSDESVRVLSKDVDTGLVPNTIIAVSIPQPVYEQLIGIANKKQQTIQEFILGLIMNYLRRVK